jgi:hypothetical protein
MKTILATLILLAATIQVKAQAPRFMLSDSLITPGLSPVPVDLAKKNSLQSICMYMFRSPADSFLFRSYHYDTAGYLIKSIIHGLNGSIGTMDSLVYDTNHQLIEMLSFYYNPYKLYYAGNYRYKGQIEELESNFMHTSITGRGFETKHYDKNNKLIKHVSRMEGTKTKYEAINKYSYDAEGFPEKIAVVNVNHLGTEKYVNLYRYSNNRQKLMVYQQTVTGKTLIVECSYNQLHQSTGAIYFYRHNTVTNDYFYHANGILYEWYQKSKNAGTVFYRFYYELGY